MPEIDVESGAINPGKGPVAVVGRVEAEERMAERLEDREPVTEPRPEGVSVGRRVEVVPLPVEDAAEPEALAFFLRGDSGVEFGADTLKIFDGFNGIQGVFAIDEVDAEFDFILRERGADERGEDCECDKDFSQHVNFLLR